jgi:hypothetical protein
MVELTVILKDSERTYKQKFLVYDDILISDGQQDPGIEKILKEAKSNFIGQPEEITIKINWEIQ